jgi:trigger factor
MHIEKILSEKLKYQFKIKAPAAELHKKFDGQLKKIGAKARIPGFRPGKAPEAILEQRYGAEAWEDAGNAILREALAEIYKDHKFRNAIDPAVDIVSFEKEKDFECKITFEALPEIDIKDFKDISLEVLKVTISDQDVEQRLKKLYEEHTRYQEPQEARAARKGDLVSVAWSGTLENGKRIELPKTYQILLGPEKEDSPFAPIVKSLYGKTAGDHFEGEVQFSNEEKVADLVGKKATIKVEVKKIEEPVSFKLDDTFAKEFASETLDDLRKSIRESLEHEAKKVAHLYTKRHLLDALDAQYTFDLPPTMVENEFKTIWDQLQRELTEARTHGELNEEDEKPEAELKSDYEIIAKRRVRLGLLISHLADIKKIKLKDEEVRMAVFQEAMLHPSQSDEIIKYYVNNNQALRNLVAPLLEDKVIDFILSESTVKDRTIDFPTLKQTVQGVIPTPYDEEFEDSQEDQKTSKATPSTGSKPKAEKAKTRETKGKEA